MNTVLIVCPTSVGGHIEHAMNTALTLSNDEETEVEVLTRKGARDYFGQRDADPHVRIHEAMTFGGRIDAVLAGTNVGRIVRFLLENLLVLSVVWRRRRSSSSCIIVEEPKYFLFRRVRGAVRAIAIVHNLVEHDLGAGGLVPRCRQRIKLASIRAYDRVVVHKAEYVASLAPQLPARVKVIASRLPGTGPVDLISVDTPPDANGREYALCIGAIRRNKNLELPVRVCARAGLPLRVVGSAEDERYVRQLEELARTNSKVAIENRFLSPAEFASTLANAKAVIIAYRDFFASSGVLARAIGLGRPVVVPSDPTFDDQVEGVNQVYRYDLQSDDDLEFAIRLAMRNASPPWARPRVDCHWEQYARSLTD